jgi:pyrimidine deaminase RibD-like protein
VRDRHARRPAGWLRLRAARHNVAMRDLDHVQLPRWHAEPQAAQIRSTRDLRWLRRAAKAAAAVDGRWRVGCVLVRSGSVLSVAANTLRNDVWALDGQSWQASEHAEMAALRLAGDVGGATAYVARIGADGVWRHAQPCLRCQHHLDRHGVHAVWSSDPEYITARRRCDETSASRLEHRAAAAVEARRVC